MGTESFVAQKGTGNTKSFPLLEDHRGKYKHGFVITLSVGFGDTYFNIPFGLVGLTTATIQPR